MGRSRRRVPQRTAAARCAKAFLSPIRLTRAEYWLAQKFAPTLLTQFAVHIYT